MPPDGESILPSTTSPPSRQEYIHKFYKEAAAAEAGFAVTIPKPDIVNIPPNMIEYYDERVPDWKDIPSWQKDVTESYHNKTAEYDRYVQETPGRVREIIWERSQIQTKEWLEKYDQAVLNETLERQDIERRLDTEEKRKKEANLDMWYSVVAIRHLTEEECVGEGEYMLKYMVIYVDHDTKKECPTKVTEKWVKDNYLTSFIEDVQAFGQHYNDGYIKDAVANKEETEWLVTRIRCTVTRKTKNGDILEEYFYFARDSKNDQDKEFVNSTTQELVDTYLGTENIHVRVSAFEGAKKKLSKNIGTETFTVDCSGLNITFKANTRQVSALKFSSRNGGCFVGK